MLRGRESLPFDLPSWCAVNPGILQMGDERARGLVHQPSGPGPLGPDASFTHPSVPYRCCFLCVLCLIPLTECCSHRTHGDLVSGLYQQILLSLQKVLADPVRPLCSHYGAVVGLHALGWKVRTLAFLAEL